jgi:hypothetical protein
MSLELWTDEYFIDYIERSIKSQIDMKFFISEKRKPTKQEYKFIFTNWVSKLKCQVTNFDLGIYDKEK